jgi:hypothetical protein
LFISWRNTTRFRKRCKDGFVGGSGDAYKKLYPKVRDALLAGEKVTIRYSNINLNEVGC